jgi:hypothetical protein
MTRIVTGLFDKHRTVDLVVEHLVQEFDVPRERVQVHAADPDSGEEARSPQDDDQEVSLPELGLPEDAIGRVARACAAVASWSPPGWTMAMWSAPWPPTGNMAPRTPELARCPTWQVIRSSASESGRTTSGSRRGAPTVGMSSSGTKFAAPLRTSGAAWPRVRQGSLRARPVLRRSPSRAGQQGIRTMVFPEARRTRMPVDTRRPRYWPTDRTSLAFRT